MSSYRGVWLSLLAVIAIGLAILAIAPVRSSGRSTVPEPTPSADGRTSSRTTEANARFTQAPPLSTAQAPLDDASPVSVSSADMRRPREAAGQDQHAEIAGPAAVPVTFLCEGEVGEAESLEVVVAALEPRRGEKTVLGLEERSATLELSRGEHVAALRAASGELGPSVTFVVEESEQTVVVARAGRTAGRARVVDFDSGVPVTGASVQLERIDDSALASASTRYRAASDATGIVEFPAVSRGVYRLSAGAAGFDFTEGEYTLPGDFRVASSGPATFDLGDLALASLQEVRFALVDHDEWPDLTAFAVSHTHEGERVAFNSEGEAALRVGWYALPLYVKLYFPDGKDSVIYLDGGLPALGEAHEIAVGGPRTLEVDVRTSEETRRALSTRAAWINVSFRSVNGDANKLGIRWDEGADFVFRSVQANEAVIALEVVDPPRTAVWTTQRVRLRESGTTVHALIVEGPPEDLVIADGEGKPVAGFTCEIRQTPETTSWLTGGTSGPDGTLSLPTIRDARCSLSGFTDDLELVAIDVELDLGVSPPERVFTISPAEPTYTEVTAGGRGVSGVFVEWIGLHSATPYFVRETDAMGATAPVDLLTHSRAEIRVDAPQYWVPFDHMGLVPGRNAIELFEVGHLVLGDSVDPSRVYHEGLGETVAQWLDSGATQIDTDSGERRRIRVPAGTFVISEGEEESRVILGAGREHHVP